PIWDNASEALLAFVRPGYGDMFLAYNIPGRPVFDVVTAVFFLVGLGVAVWRWKRPSYALLLLWFFVGITPSLITGATANTTRNLAALPAAYILPVVGFVALIEWIQWRSSTQKQAVWLGAAAVWLLFVAGVTVNDYFVRWGTAVDVRDAYQHTLIEEIDYLQQKAIAGPVVMSSVYPGPVHDPSIYYVMFGGRPIATRWVDARYAMILPAQSVAHVVVPASTPLHPVFAPLLTPLETVALRDDDLNPGFTFYQLEPESGTAWYDASLLADFDGAVTLQYAGWAASEYAPGDVAELLTVWQVHDPNRIGPIVPPSNTTDVVMFTHVLGAAGEILTQRDALDAPSWSWQSGDLVLQIHQMALPIDITAGSYQTMVGIYDRASGDRRPVVDSEGNIIDTAAAVVPLRVK
ncbi:MAG: hypothetical protein KC419_18440, partial [Anaerolineales bacterium]|nr:hypothetical protein [Anaerolineales bacterium]